MTPDLARLGRSLIIAPLEGDSSRNRARENPRARLSGCGRDANPSISLYTRAAVRGWYEGTSCSTRGRSIWIVESRELARPAARCRHMAVDENEQFELRLTLRKFLCSDQ